MEEFFFSSGSADFRNCVAARQAVGAEVRAALDALKASGLAKVAAEAEDREVPALYFRSDGERSEEEAPVSGGMVSIAKPSIGTMPMALNIDEHRWACRNNRTNNCEFKRIPLTLGDFLINDKVKRPGGGIHETKIRILYPKATSRIVSYCQPEASP